MSASKGLIYDHAPWPGPQHWDWRCLVCSEPVDRHAGILARWRWRRLRYRLGMPTGRLTRWTPERICPTCRVERADWEHDAGGYLPTCPNCGSTAAPVRWTP